MLKNLPANAGDVRDPGWIPGLGRSPGGLKDVNNRDFPGSPVVRTLCFHCRGHRFNPCLGN